MRWISKIDTTRQYISYNIKKLDLRELAFTKINEVRNSEYVVFKM